MEGNVFYREAILMSCCMCAETLIFFACTEKTPKRKYVPLIMWGKAFFINFILTLVLGSVYHDRPWYWMAESCASVAGATFYICIVKSFTELTWSKWSLILIFSEFTALGVTYIPLALIGILGGHDIFLVLWEGETGYDLLYGFTEACLLILLYRKGNHWFAWIRNRKIRYPALWVGLLIVFYMTGNVLTVISAFIKIRFLYPHISLIIVILVLVVLIFLFLKATVRRLSLQNENLKLQRNMIKDYYFALQQQIELVRKFRHDIANHLQTVELLAKLPDVRSAEIDEYEEVLRKQHQRLATIGYCSNPVIDAALAGKVRYCKKMEIPIEISMSGVNFSEQSIEELDLLGLLFNLLDNAIESCMKIRDHESRHIELQCFQTAGCFVLLMKNSFLEVVEQNHRLITTKRDKKYHGVGMSIVSDIVKKYDGGMDITYEYGEACNDFCIRINLHSPTVTEDNI